MPDLAAHFPAARRWPPRNPDAIQLYSLPTPNGVKVSTMLEECELAYDAHRIEFGERGTASPEFRALNPNGKIPAIVDPHGPGGMPLALWESGAILIYLADKSGRFLAPSGPDREHAIQWLFWQMSALGPMFGQVGFFNKFAGREWEDKRPLARYVTEAQRLLGVLDQRLADREWIVDAYGIADIACLGWVRNLIGFYEARELVGFDRFANVARWLDAGLARPAVQRGLTIPASP